MNLEKPRYFIYKVTPPYISPKMKMAKNILKGPRDFT
tara:strand:- start:378 stop:488 length:111 start_codon:yes stop_codon:yes gene_type:complete